MVSPHGKDFAKSQIHIISIIIIIERRLINFKFYISTYTTRESSWWRSGAAVDKHGLQYTKKNKNTTENLKLSVKRPSILIKITNHGKITNRLAAKCLPLKLCWIIQGSNRSCYAKNSQTGSRIGCSLRLIWETQWIHLNSVIILIIM